MKHFVLFAVLAFAFDAGPAHGATGPSFPLCLNTSVETQCPASVVPKSSCYYVRDDCKELWDKDGIGKKPLRRTKRLIQVKLGVYEYFHKQRSYPNPSLLFSGIECSESLDVVVKLSIPKANITSCVRFNFSSPDQTCSDIKELLYDCRWLRDQYNVVEVPWTIEYRAINGVCGEYAKYHFSLPKNGTADREVTGFNDFQLLIYREDEQCPPCEFFRWSKPPEKFEVTKYRVTLHYKENNVTRALSTTFVEDTIVSFCTLPEVGTNYYVSVAPCRECSGNNCICGAESFSNPFYTRIITTQGITVLGLVLSFLVLLLLILGWNLIRVYAGRKVAKYKKCILMFEPSSKSHVIILTKLVRFLEKSMNVRVLFGEKDIGNENSTDWYSTKLKEADLVLIVSNPTPNNLEDVAAASTYYPVYTSGCVKEFLRDIIHSEKKFIRILLPYCTDKHFYDFTTTKRCYSLKKDPRRLLQEIIGPSFWLPPIVGWAMFAPYFDTDEWADLLVALDKYPYLYSAAMGDDSDYEGSCRTSVSDEDEAIPMDVMPRVAMLQAREDEESSGSDSESPPHKSLEAVSLKSVDVAIDNLVDAQLFNNV